MANIFLTAASTNYWCGRYLGLSMLLVLLSAGLAESSSVTLAWDPNPEGDIAGYIISYGTSSQQYTSSVDVGNTTTFVFSVPDPTKTYYLAVQAYNISGLRSPFSNEVRTSSVSQPLTITKLTSNAPPAPRVGTTITFTTAAAGGVAPYQYKWWVFDGATSIVGQDWSTSNTFAWTPMQPKPSYRITVWARNASSIVDKADNPAAILSTTLAVGVAPSVSVNTVTPNSGSTEGGATITISGANFASGATVSFGGTAATTVTVVRSTTITARAPAHAAGAVTVVVTNPSNQSATRANAFTYVAPPPPPPSPTVSNVVPSSGTTKGGTTVTITGKNFANGATVSFGGVPAATAVIVASSTSIVATTPAHASGAVNVVVTNPSKESGTRATGFTYRAPGPSIASVSPASGSISGGTAVVIRGVDFASGATVSFGGTAATNVIVVNSKLMTARVPAHAAGSVNVVVTNANRQSGARASGFSYVVTPPPSASSLPPPRPPAG